MLNDDDLKAAVAESIITDAQAAALRTLALRRGEERQSQDPAPRESSPDLGSEERFRFMRGFNDFFLAIGVVLLCWSMVYFAKGGAVENLIAAILVWGLAELLVARMRLVLPGILLACFFVIFVFNAIPIDGWFANTTRASPQMPRNWTEMLFSGGTFGRLAPFAIAVKAFVAGGTALLFYARFRLPFALLPVAASAVLAIAATASQLSGAAPALVLLLCGLAVFTIAMRFDVTDRERVTRRSDCAFWLHLLAAPLIVHSLISLVTTNAFSMTGPVAAGILLMVALLAFIAITIDRRALLVSALVYLGSVIAYAISTAAIDGKETLFYTLAVLGIMVVALGVGWQPLRRNLLVLLPSFLVRYLPPVSQRP